MPKTINTKILLRNDTPQNWATRNPVLSKGEIGIALQSLNGTTLCIFKIGDGVTHWNDLISFTPPPQIPIESISVNTTHMSPDNLGNVDITVPIDLSDLTDNNGLIPGDLSDLTDNQGLIPVVPSDISQLTDDNNVIPTDLSNLTDNNGLIPTDLSDLTDNNNIIPTVPILSISVNTQEITPDNNSNVDITIPTSLSEFTNDAGFITTSDIPEGAAASTTTPLMDGTASIGTELAFARGDHRHPSDNTKVDKVTGKGLSTNDYTTTEKNKLAGIEEGAQANFIVSATSKTVTNPDTQQSYVQQVTFTDKNNQSYPFFTSDGTANLLLDTYDLIVASVKAQLGAVFKYKGVKATVAELPSTNNNTGDVWHITEDGSEYVWNGSAWQELGSTIDLSNYLQSASIAGLTINTTNSTITAGQLQSALSLGTAAYKGVDTSISVGSSSANLPTAAAVATYVANNSTKVESSATNGNIKVNNSELSVYTLPSTTLDSSDTLILDCGLSSSNYS